MVCFGLYSSSVSCEGGKSKSILSKKLIAEVPDDVAFRFKVTLVAVFDITTAPEGIPVPVTIMPALIPVVEAIDEIVGFPLVVVPISLMSFHSSLGIYNDMDHPNVGAELKSMASLILCTKLLIPFSSATTSVFTVMATLLVSILLISSLKS